MPTTATTKPTTTKRIAIEPLTRVEGHGKVTILLGPDNRVEEARLHIVEFRGFERFIQGRPFWELPVLVQRLCGICPVSHHLCAAKAVDGIIGAEKLTPAGDKLRRLMHFGQMYQSHVLHFFHLASPDLLFGFDAPVAERNVFGVLAANRDLAIQAVKMRKFGQEIIKATSGKKVHGTGAIPGGMNKNLSIAERDTLLADLEQNITWSRQAVEIAKQYTLDHLDEIADFGSFESNHLSLVRGDGAMELYDGKLRSVDAHGETLIDHVDPQDYVAEIAEEVRPWSYMKFPFLRSVGMADGWFRVGPLARVNTCDFIDSPEAEAARKDFLSLTDGKPSNVTMAYHWARMIEVLHSIEMIRDLLHDPILQSNDLVTPPGERRGEYVAMIEAPRGTLTHHYKVNADDQVTMANLMVSTTCNNEPMNRTVRKIADDVISGQPEITEALLNNIEVGIRAYDPCLSCATHALGQMPLVVTLLDHEGNQLDERTRS